MKLPQEILNYDQSYQEIVLKFSKKKIRIRKYLTQEIRKYLNATSTVDNDWNWNYETFKLFRACVSPEDYEVADSIGKADFIYALSYLRSISYDPTISRPHSCPYCGWWVDGYTISVLKNIKFEPEVPETEYVYETKNGEIFHFRPLPYSKELEIIRNKNTAEYIQVAHEILCNSIDKMIINGTAYENVDIDDIKQYIDTKLSIQDYTDLLGIMADKKILFWIHEDLTCPSCKKEYIMSIEEPYFFVQV